jgi:hypothetical protein
MASGTFRSLISLGALVALVVATGATIYGIMQENRSQIIAEDFIIPAALGNSIAVMFLIFLTATVPTRSVFYKMFVILILMVGLIVEIYLTMYANQMPDAIATYIVIVLNFLIRMFYVLEFVQDDWASFSAATSVQSVVSQARQQMPSAKPMQTVSEPSEDDTLRKDFISKWDRIKNKVRDASEGLLKESESDAWKNVMRPALDSKSYTVEKLKEAASKLKHEDGSPVAVSSLEIRGGRKR